MRTPNEEAVRGVIHDWREAIIAKEKLDQGFLKEVLLAMTEGMLMLDDRIASVMGDEWKGARTIIAMQDEMNEMRYKMILLQEALRK